MPILDRKEPPSIPREALRFPNQNVVEHRPQTVKWVLIGLIVLLAIILVGLVTWFMLMQQTPEPVVPSATRPTIEENDEPESATQEAITQTEQVLSPSTELTSIRTDLDGTQLVELEPLFADIEALFQ